MDLNLDTLKREILEYLGNSQLPVFYSAPSSLEGSGMVIWDVERHPDYRMFLETARAAGAALIIFAAREFDSSDLDDLLGHLGELDLTREEQRDYETRLRELRRYEGVICSIELAFDANNRLYVYELQPDWYEEFSGLEEEIMARIVENDDMDDDEPLGGYFSKN